MGRTSSWDDEQHWIVCWLPTRELAEKYRKLAQERSDEIRHGGYDQELPKNEFDPLFRIDYTTGTDYCIEAVSKGKLPEGDDAEGGQ